MFLKNITLIVVFTFYIFHFRHEVLAQEMTAPGYRLKMQQIEASPSAKVGNLLSHKDQEIFDRKGFITYTVSEPIKLMLAKTELNFEEFKSGISQLKESNIRISSNPQVGFQATLHLSKNFSTNAKDIFPETKCESGNSCTGWGFNFYGRTNSVTGFESKDFFRALEFTKDFTFVNMSPILDSKLLTFSSTLRIKATPPDDLKDGNYSTNIKIIVLPNL